MRLAIRFFFWIMFNGSAGVLMDMILPKSLNLQLIELNFVWTVVMLNMKQALIAGLFVILTLITVYRGESIFGSSAGIEKAKEAEAV